jgi:hypothetical protein
VRAAAGDDPNATYDALRWRMGALARLLTPFRRDQMLNQFDAVLPIPRPRKPAPAALDPPADPAAAATGQGGGPSGGAPSTEGQRQAAQAQQEAEDRALQQALAAVEAEDAGGAGGAGGAAAARRADLVDTLAEVYPQTADAELQAAAAPHPPFIPAAAWRGRLHGYAFGRGDDGAVGYRIDATQARPLAELVSHFFFF